MMKTQMINKLLRQDAAINPNSLLLKKIILATHYGWFRINGRSPDTRFSVEDYLFDEERVVVDYTGLSKNCKQKLEKWLFRANIQQAQRRYLEEITTNDYRGYTTEVGLSWWGWLTNYFFYQKKSYYWPLSSLELTLDYQLNGLDVCFGRNGFVLGLNQHSLPKQDNKYHSESDDQSSPLRNVKRLQFTDEIVNRLTNLDLEKQNYQKILREPHNFATKVKSYPKHFSAMYEYRQTQRLILIPWYERLWNWFGSWFSTPIKEQNPKSKAKVPVQICKHGEVRVYKRPDSEEIIVTEKRPDLQIIVLCGGGAKCYAHLGALWAFKKVGINPERLAGSSGGGILSILCYLGYSIKEMYDFLKQLNKDNIIYYDIDWAGLSDTKAIKSMLDYMIIKKVNHIINQYELNNTPEGQQFVKNIIFRDGKITFESLRLIKERYPDCGFGGELIVPATEIKARKTHYFSTFLTPDMEVSAAGCASASLPGVFKPTMLENGKLFNDGGMLDNFPTKPFQDDHDLLLKSEQSNCFKLIAFQFDNGPEKEIMETFVHKVYRENMFINWFYELLSGVKDPVSGWEADRMKLRQYSNQAVLISTGKVSSTDFNISPANQRKIIRNGYKAAISYIHSRYNIIDGVAQNDEYLYTTFSCINEALFYCCYRGRKDWFDYLAPFAQKDGLSKEKILQLRQDYFSPKSVQLNASQPTKTALGSNPRDVENLKPTYQQTLVNDPGKVNKSIQRACLFEAIYPIFLKLPDKGLTRHAYDLKLYKQAKHNFSLNNPLECLLLLSKMKGEMHILLKIFIHLLTAYQNFPETSSLEKTCAKLARCQALIENLADSQDPIYVGNWYLLPKQVDRLLNQEAPSIKKFCEQAIQKDKTMPSLFRKVSAKDLADKSVKQDKKYLGVL